MQKDVGSSLALDQSFLCMSFRLCDFSHFFSCHQRFLPSFFWYFATERMLEKSQRVPSFRFFGTLRLLKILFCFFFAKFFKSRFNFLKFGNRMDV